MSAYKNILYIEDTKDDLERFENYAKRAGFDVEFAETIDKAVMLLSSKKYLAIILDIMVYTEQEELKPKDENIPKYMGGVKLLEMILENKFFETGNDKNTPVLVVSAVALAPVRERIKSLLGKYHEDRYLTKPSRPIDIIKSLEKAIDN